MSLFKTLRSANQLNYNALGNYLVLCYCYLYTNLTPWYKNILAKSVNAQSVGDVWNFGLWATSIAHRHESSLHLLHTYIQNPHSKFISLYILVD